MHEAIKEYIDEIKSMDGEGGFEADKSGPLAAQIKRRMFRILQEGLTTRRGMRWPSPIAVSLKAVKTLSPDDLRYRYRFDVQFAQHRRQDSMIIMRERMRAVGGGFTIESRSGQGTTITASVPREHNT